MTNSCLVALPIVVLLVLLTCSVSGRFIVKKIRNLFAKKRKTMPSATELRMRGVPLIESVPFWAPGKAGAGELVGLEIQPSVHGLMPYASKQRQTKVVSEDLTISSIFLVKQNSLKILFKSRTTFKANECK